MTVKTISPVSKLDTQVENMTAGIIKKKINETKNPMSPSSILMGDKQIQSINKFLKSDLRKPINVDQLSLSHTTFKKQDSFLLLFLLFQKLNLYLYSF